MAKKIFVFQVDSKSLKKNLLRKVRLFQGSRKGDLGVYSSVGESKYEDQSIVYNPHAYAVIDERMRDIEAQKAITLARTQKLTF